MKICSLCVEPDRCWDMISLVLQVQIPWLATYEFMSLNLISGMFQQLDKFNKRT